MNQLDLFNDSLRQHELFQDLAPHIVESFWKYHQENPGLWALFKKYSQEMKAAGRRHYGITVISERIRWHIQVETRGDQFKLNNNYRSCYARLLMIDDPSLEGFFATRASPGKVEIFQ